MRRELYEHLQRLSPRFYATTRLGDIVSRINNDIGEIQRVAAETALAWVGNVLFLARQRRHPRSGSTGGCFSSAWRRCRWRRGRSCCYRRRLEARSTELRERSADIGSFLIETLQGMRTVVTSDAERREVGAVHAAERRVHRDADGPAARALRRRRRAVAAARRPARRPSSSTAAGAWSQGTLTLGTLAAFMAYQARVVAPMQALMGLYGALATARVSWRRVAEILDTPAGRDRTPGRARRSTSVRGDVEFDDVSLSHGRGGAVLDGVSFRAEPGAALAIVGASGSGKSTIADLLRAAARSRRRHRAARRPRSAHAATGRPPASRAGRRAGAVLFHASIEENVRYARPDATDADVAAALEAAGLARFVAALPDGAADDRRRPRAGALGRRAAARRARARVSRRSRGARARRAERGARSGRRTARHRGLSPRHARPDDDRHLAPARARSRRPIASSCSTARGSSSADDRPSSRRAAARSRRSSAPTGRVTVSVADVDVHACRSRTARRAAPAAACASRVVDSGIHAAHPHVGGIAGGVAFDDDGRRAETSSIGSDTARRSRRRFARRRRTRRCSRSRSSIDRSRRRAARSRRAIRWAAAAARRARQSQSGDDEPRSRAGARERDHRGPRRRRHCRRGSAARRSALAARRARGCHRRRAGLGVPARGVRRASRPDGGRCVLRASGFPRPIPGVPPDRNLKGASFAVANATGLLALAIEDRRVGSIADLIRCLQAIGADRAAPD